MKTVQLTPQRAASLLAAVTYYMLLTTMWQSWRQKKNYNTLLSWLRTICVLLLATIMRANVYKLLCIIMFNKFISNNWTSLCSASSTRLSTWHCPCLMPSAVLRRRCCCAPAPAIDRYPARRALSSKPVARRSCCRTMGQTTNGRTDRQTDRPTRDRSIDPAPHADCQ